MTGVAIVGASGYAARELIRILLNHPGAKITMATSRQDEAPRIDEGPVAGPEVAHQRAVAMGEVDGIDRVRPRNEIGARGI